MRRTRCVRLRGPEHLLLALLDQELLGDWQGLRADAERKVAALPAVQGGQQQPSVSSSLSRVFDQADKERERRNSKPPNKHSRTRKRDWNLVRFPRINWKEPGARWRRQAAKLRRRRRRKSRPTATQRN